MRVKIQILFEDEEKTFAYPKAIYEALGWKKKFRVVERETEIKNMSYYFSSLVAFNLGMHKHFRFRITKVKLFSSAFHVLRLCHVSTTFNGNQKRTKKKCEKNFFCL